MNNPYTNPPLMSRSTTKYTLSCIAVALCCLLFSCSKTEKQIIEPKPYTTWSSYLGGTDRNHFSNLSQITKENVSKLKIAWSYSAPDVGQMQMNPIIVDTILYGVTAALQAFAINAETGKEIWLVGDTLKVYHSTSRGVSYWRKGSDQRIFYTRGSELFALNALTGNAIQSFGNNGKIDLRSGLPKNAKEKFVISNTPGTIYEDLIIMPTRVSESEGAAPGNLMAYNTITGNLVWAFHAIPHPNEKGYNTWENKEHYKDGIIGGGNNWAGMALDEKTGILYVPTGSMAPDFYGGDRLGSNLFGNCLLALDVNTGALIWHYQLTHHDLWDRDPPAPPNLITVTRKGKKIPAVAQVTKQGYVFVFDRKTGKPLFDIEERPVPKSNLEGEESWPTQPIPILPKPYARLASDITEEDMSPYAENKQELREEFSNLISLSYAPPSLDPVFLLPGYDGGAEWGGAGADPEDGIIYVNSNEMPWVMQMEVNKGVDKTQPLGSGIYQNYCAACHQKDRKGMKNSGIPTLINIKDRTTKAQVTQVVTNGKGMMTGFPQLTDKEKAALISFLFEEGENNAVSNKPQMKKEVVVENNSSKYKHKGYKKFLDSNGHPGISPPWGTLHAINLNDGSYIWSVPFGETPELKVKGFPTTGSENYGGPVVTENGLLFIAATKDGYFRAFDKSNGEILWEYKLPAAAFATPAMYEVNGRQYIAIACGGEKLGTEKGRQIIAFSLDEK